MAATKGSGRGGMRQGAGRKPKPPGEQRRNRVMLSFKDDEWDALVRAAGFEPLGSWIRRLVLRSLARRRK